MPPIQPHCWPYPFYFCRFIAIIRPDHPFIVDFSATWYRFNWHFPGGILICLPSDGLYLLSACTPIDSYIFLFSTNGIVSLECSFVDCRDQVLAGITFLLWILSWTTLHQNLSETYLLLKLYYKHFSHYINNLWVTTWRREKKKIFTAAEKNYKEYWECKESKLSDNEITVVHC